VVVGALQEGGPAEKGGLKRGDIITAVDGKRITTADDYRAMMTKAKPGHTMEFKLLRDKEEQTVKIRVGRRGAAVVPKQNSLKQEYSDLAAGVAEAGKDIERTLAHKESANPLRISAQLGDIRTTLRRMSLMTAEPYRSQLAAIADEVRTIYESAKKGALTAKEAEAVSAVVKQVSRDFASDKVIFRDVVLPEKP
jgi:membrane-associated protease RseP (regulator of RpoE activity)